MYIYIHMYIYYTTRICIYMIIWGLRMPFYVASEFMLWNINSINDIRRMSVYIFLGFYDNLFEVNLNFLASLDIFSNVWLKNTVYLLC